MGRDKNTSRDNHQQGFLFFFFLWKNTIHRFGLLHMLITDNETQFDNRKMRE